MPAKFECPLSNDELKKLYTTEGRTLGEMCEIVGCRSEITMSKILRSAGIDTNKNKIIAQKNRHGMSEDEFKNFLISEYEHKNNTLSGIARKVGVTRTVIKRYLVKYGIPLKSPNDVRSSMKGEKNPNWNGGRIVRNEYIEVYTTTHPRRGTRNYMYEHIIVMEKHIGRYLEPGEVVHHINGNKIDNRIENLLLLTNSEHIALHAKLKKEGAKNEQKSSSLPKSFNS